MPVTLVSSATVANTTIAQSSNGTTVYSITPAVGDVVVVFAGTQSSTSVTITSLTSSSSGLVFTQRQAFSQASACPVNVWTSTATSNAASTITVNYHVANTTTGNYTAAMVVERWSGAQLATTPASTSGVNTTAQSSLTTTQPGSVLSWVDFDFNAVQSSSRTYVGSAAELFYNFYSTNTFTLYAAHQYVPTPGSTSFGLSSSTGQKATMAAVEIVPADTTSLVTPYLFPTTVSTTGTTGTFNNPTFATGSTAGSFATWTGASSGIAGQLTFTGTGVETAVPGNATILSVLVTVKSYITNVTAIPIETASLVDGVATVTIGSASVTPSTTTTNIQQVSFVGGSAPTVSQLPALQLVLRAAHANSSTSSTFNVDTVSMVVNYSLPTINTGQFFDFF